MNDADLAKIFGKVVHSGEFIEAFNILHNKDYQHYFDNSLHLGLLSAILLRETGQLNDSLNLISRLKEKYTVNPYILGEEIYSLIGLGYINQSIERIENATNQIQENNDVISKLKAKRQVLQYYADSNIDSKSDNGGYDFATYTLIENEHQKNILSPARIGNAPLKTRWIDGWFDSESRCWYGVDSGSCIKELIFSDAGFSRFSNNQNPSEHKELPSQFDGIIDEPCIWIPMNPHYGHFITQIASFFSGLHLVNRKKIRVLISGLIPKYLHELLLWNGISENRITQQFSGKFRAKNLFVTQASWCEWIYSHPDHRLFFEYATKSILNKSQLNKNGVKVYFSRDRLSQALRFSQNEKEVEDIASSLGYVIAYPEKMSLRDQIHLINSASVIAGSSGSAMHSILFNVNEKFTKTIKYLSHHLPIHNCHLIDGITPNCESIYVKAAEQLTTEKGAVLEFDLKKCREILAY